MRCDNIFGICRKMCIGMNFFKSLGASTQNIPNTENSPLLYFTALLEIFKCIVGPLNDLA